MQFDLTQLAMAAQLVKGNVEREDSPQQRGGLQTLYHTGSGEDALSSAEVLDLESHLNYEASDNSTHRHLFFRMEKKFVVARVVPRPGTDRFGRGGRYIAHAFVFRPEEFEKIECNPFYLFQGKFFVSTEEETLALGKDRLFDNSMAIHTVRGLPAPNAGICGMTPDQLALLILSACRAHQLLDNRQGLAFLGSSDEMLVLLASVFSALTPALRRECTFDTLMSPQSASTSVCWALGLPAGSRIPSTLFPFSLAVRRFEHEPPLEPTSPPERCLPEVVNHPRLEPADKIDLLLQYRAAEAIHDAIQNQTPFPSICLGRVAAVYRTANRAAFDRAVNLHLDGAVSGALRQKLTREVYDAWLKNQEKKNELALGLWKDGPHMAQVAEWLKEFAIEQKPSVLRKYNEDLQQFVATSGDDLWQSCKHLSLLEAMRLLSTSNWKELSKVLDQAPNADWVRYTCTRWWLEYRRLTGFGQVGYLEEGVLVGCQLTHEEPDEAAEFVEQLSILSGLKINNTWSKRAWKKRVRLLTVPDTPNAHNWTDRVREQVKVGKSRGLCWVLQRREDQVFFGVLFLKRAADDVRNDETLLRELNAPSGYLEARQLRGSKSGWGRLLSGSLLCLAACVLTVALTQQGWAGWLTPLLLGGVACILAGAVMLGWPGLTSWFRRLPTPQDNSEPGITIFETLARRARNKEASQDRS